MKHSAVHYFLIAFLVLIRSSVNVIAWILFGMGGYLIFQAHYSPLDIVIGLPMMLIGIGFIINYSFNVVFAFFDKKYNRGICFLCK